MSDVGGFEGKILCEVPQSCAPCDSRDTCDTTTSEQLAEIEGQAESTPATGYTPPEGWRVLAVGEQLQEGDQIVQLHDGKRFPTERAGQYVCETQRYIRRIEPQPEPSPQPQPNAATIEELRSEVSYVYRVLGASRERVTHLEELVTSLRTINEAQEKAFNAAGKANDDLQHRLNVVSAEWAEQAETLREQLQQANDRLAFLETLQPIAAACHTAQTMVRDMLGHMRCLLALHHTTDRRNFCTLLESILEVFDEAGCDEDEDDDTDDTDVTDITDTSEAGQG